jgi:hypothetical protein
LVIVLDDFEQNLEIPGEGEAHQLKPLAAELLEVVLSVCRAPCGPSSPRSWSYV